MPNGPQDKEFAMVPALVIGRYGFRCGIAVAALVLATAPAIAGLIPVGGSQAFGDLSTTVAGTTNNISSATSFTFGSFITTSDNLGHFAGLPMQFFGPETFTVSDPLSMQFSSAAFGSFASSKITQLTNTAGSRSFEIEGLYTKGTFGDDFNPNPASAILRISFNQTGGTGAAISSNSTLQFAAQPVPEPTTLALLVVAAGTAGVLRARRRSA
jgi:hypothetical protein